MTLLPSNLRLFRKIHKLDSTNTFTTTNPKTLKNGKVSDSPTLVLHLEPVTGGVCPAAGSCAAVCLHKAGNPLYLEGKTAARRRRSRAWLESRELFVQNLVVEAARARSRGYVGLRLNGTSDIAWERQLVYLSQELIDWVRAKVPTFRVREPGNYNLIAAMVSLGLQPYDYTKRIDRDWATAAAYGYHLTLSWGGKHDPEVFEVAARHKLNVAAAIAGVGRKKPLPATVTHGGRTYPVADGDVTDWRRQDPAGRVHVVGLRLKRTPGQTAEQAKRFCLPT